MFDNFQEAVRLTYLSLKANGDLHFDSKIPSTGVLKKWCLQTFQKGLSQDDEQVFNLFFERINTEDCLERIIKKTDPDKFRPLRNFIAGTTKSNPDERLVKILAILINFKPRPYRSTQWILSKYDKVSPSYPTTIRKKNCTAASVQSPNKTKFYWPRVLRFLTISLLMGVVIYPNAKKYNCLIEQNSIAIQRHESITPSILIKLDKPRITESFQTTDTNTILNPEIKLWYWKLNSEKQENKKPIVKPQYFTLSINIAF